MTSLYFYLCRCEEPACNPSVSNSIGEGVIEEEEEEEGAEELNKKRMKADDQEVQSLSVTFLFYTTIVLLKIKIISPLQVKKESFYTWRVELSKTEKYWDGWFRGLSALFLSCSVPKLLLLAGLFSFYCIFYLV